MHGNRANEDMGLFVTWRAVSWDRKSDRCHQCHGMGHRDVPFHGVQPPESSSAR